MENTDREKSHQYYFHPEKFIDEKWQVDEPWVLPTNEEVELPELIKDFYKIQERYPFGENGQICLTHTPEAQSDVEKVYGGSGSLQPGQEEFDFFQFNQEFKDTAFFNLFQECQKHWRVGRMRLMHLAPHRCYSMHRDRNHSRYHVALITNRFCHIVYQDRRLYHIPADGYVYEMNTYDEHTAINAGETSRIHLVYELGPQDHTIAPPNS